MMAPTVYCVDDWLRVNQQYFQPPVCVKMMYRDGQIQAFFVGGPNERQDFHVEEGEEFFYQVKGDMCLKVMERGKLKDICIKEGEVFLLPSRIPHSPRRYKDTTGFVIERRRNNEEFDCLRFYTHNGTDVLYEKWFHLDSLDNQVEAAIKEFKQSQQCKTGKPISGTITNNPPFRDDEERTMEEPFSLTSWIQKHRKEIKEKGKKVVFEGDYATQVVMYGNGTHEEQTEKAETFLWQWASNSTVKVNGKPYRLKQNHTTLIDAGKKWNLENEETGLTLAVTMHATKQASI